MFFTGYSRAADEVLAEQVTKSQSGDQAMIDNLHFVKDLGLRQLDALEKDDVRSFADLMHEHWLNKKKRSSSMSNARIDHLYDVGRNAGARGGKLVGAGAGGFLMFYAEDTRRVRAAMREEGLDRAAVRDRPGRQHDARARVGTVVQCVDPGRRSGHADVAGGADRPEDAAPGRRPALRRLAARLAGRGGRDLGRLLHRLPRRAGAWTTSATARGGGWRSGTSTRARSCAAPEGRIRLALDARRTG